MFRLLAQFKSSLLAQFKSKMSANIETDVFEEEDSTCSMPPCMFHRLQQMGVTKSEGSNWYSYTCQDSYSQEEVYLTWDQVLKEECFNEANAQAKIEYAEALGEGVNEPGKPKGWYRDESRHNAPVFTTMPEIWFTQSSCVRIRAT